MAAAARADLLPGASFPARPWRRRRHGPLSRCGTSRLKSPSSPSGSSSTRPELLSSPTRLSSSLVWPWWTSPAARPWRAAPPPWATVSTPWTAAATTWTSMAASAMAPHPRWPSSLPATSMPAPVAVRAEGAASAHCLQSWSRRCSSCSRRTRQELRLHQRPSTAPEAWEDGGDGQELRVCRRAASSGGEQERGWRPGKGWNGESRWRIYWFT
ncbi:hypothetical protein PVAP13_1KG066454 [Panicum virgatum]|uniref:Uncharacterized protein n=1 Tax=Panicum virgatum TaxID=38727 RepID=A0A8T0X7W2_PANVG|nr:hypothetical protein PVAP13_1KG066454 [Panicum virgatum]